jgi:hypothetical protein
VDAPCEWATNVKDKPGKPCLVARLQDGDVQHLHALAFVEGF